MLKRCKTNIKYILAGLTVLLLTALTLNIDARDSKPFVFFKLLTPEGDTIIGPKPLQAKDTIIKKDTVKQPGGQDTVIRQQPDTSVIHTDSLQQENVIDTLIFSKDSLDAPVNYTAEDSGVLVISDKKFYLYGKATSSYNDIKLDANTISYDQETQIIKAFGGTDTSLGVLNKPKLTQGGTESISDTIFFNMKTQRGMTKNTYYKEGEMFINAEKFKMVTKDVGFGYRTSFTTCNLDTPHFAFRTKKIKIINDKIAVSGPATAEFEGVPMPIALPFGIFPLSTGRHSGLLPPQFASSEDFGLGLENLGYYKVLNENWDFTIRGNLYSYGGWSANITPQYYKRYKYKGSMNLAIQNTKLLNDDPSAKEEFTVSKGWFITWNHSTDTRARPGTSFSANVRAGSTQYNKYVTNNANINFQNQLSSSITWSKTWNNGKNNLSVAANHDQNNNTRLVNLRLPTVNFSASTIYPLQRREFAGTPKWYEKLGVSYNGTLLNQFAFYDSAFSIGTLRDTAQWGVDHKIPVTLSLPPLGPVMVAPGMSYAERWYGQIINRTWNEKTNKVDTTITKGFYVAREMSFSLSLNTRIFGTANFPKSKGVRAIRHEMKPFASINYKPDLVSQYYSEVQIDTLGNTYTFNELQGGVIGAFSRGKFGGISFGLDNLFEMKVKDKNDTAASAVKKVRLIDGLGISSGYNFLADSLQLSPFSITLRSTLFEKINITGSTSLDPYDVDSLGRRIDKLMWKEGKLGRISNGSLAISTSFRSKTKDGKDKETMPVDETLTPDEQMAQLDYIRANPTEFVDFEIPWNVSLSFSFSFSRTLSPNLKDYETRISSNISVNGDFSLTPKWKIGGSTYYDFRTTQLQSLTMFITREMHCWQLSINVTPVGLYRSFNISINPKSGILRDLKVNRSRFFYSQ